MVSIRNIEKFLKDHSEILADEQKRIMEEARQKAEEGILSGKTVEDIMGRWSSEFFKEVEYSREHHSIFNDDFGEAEKKRKRKG